MTIEVEIEGLYESREVTKEELDAWEIYADSRPYLLSIGYINILDMFLSHFRLGINLNVPVKRGVEQL